jgi:SAM-dependent methyltransferase
MNMATQAYIGSELELFARAIRWKSYFRQQLKPYLGACVLEVGAGIGGTTRILCDGKQQSWVCLEPDPGLAGQIRSLIGDNGLPSCCQVVVGTLTSIDEGSIFDTILYIDVLEHIKDDKDELQTAARHVKDGGVIVVLSPAHQFLYSQFDRQIGHFRRYSRRTLLEIPLPGFRCVALKYLDSFGLLASLGNRLLLRQNMPTLKQVKWWDNHLVPISRIVDPLLRYKLGKSVLAVWQKV